MQQQIVKNITYPNLDDLIVMVGEQVLISPKMQEMSEEQQHAYKLMFLQKTRGSQLFIKKEVTDELSKTDIHDIQFKDINFVFDTAELFFEDANISTIIMSSFFDKKNKKNIIRGISLLWTTKNKDGFENAEIVIYSENQFNKAMANNNYSPDLYNAMEPEYRVEYTQDEIIESKTRVVQYIRLVAKVLLFISIPEYKAIPITKKDIKRQCKPGVKNRPNRPMFKVIYVPSIININKQNNHLEKTGKNKVPHMRRGHFMMLRDERYKEQGKLIFRKPCMIHGGSLSDKLYVARKI